MTHKIKNSICIGCGHLEQETITTVCCPDNKYITIQEYLINERNNTQKWAKTFKENRELKSKLKEAEEQNKGSYKKGYTDGYRDCSQMVLSKI